MVQTARKMFYGYASLLCERVLAVRKNNGEVGLPFLEVRRSRDLGMTSANARPEQNAMCVWMWIALTPLFCSKVCLLNRTALRRKWATRTGAWYLRVEEIPPILAQQRVPPPEHDVRTLKKGSLTYSRSNYLNEIQVLHLKPSQLFHDDPETKDAVAREL